MATSMRKSLRELQGQVHPLEELVRGVMDVHSEGYRILVGPLVDIT